MTDPIDAKVKESQEIVDACAKHLAGHGHMVQGAALADLLSMWLSGVQGEDAEEVRKQMLDNLIRTVNLLTPINSEITLNREMKKATRETKQ